MQHRRATEEMKQFLQEGLQSYAPAALAIAEFQRQVRLRIQMILDDFAQSFAEFGLDISALNQHGTSTDNLDAESNSAFIGLKKDHAQGLFASYSVAWNFDLDEGEQLWAIAYLYAGRKRTARDRLFKALETLQAAGSNTYLQQESDGGASLYAYFPVSEFHNLEVSFRELIQEWTGLLTAIGGVQQYLSTAPVSESE